MKDYDSWKLQNDRDDRPFDEPEPEPDPEPVARCEHCGKWIFDGEDYLSIERHSGPSSHWLHFHKDCWRCPKCGTNGPHYCPSDIARE